MTNKAWVTLATNDTYSLGALVLAHSLRRVNTAHTLVVLITTGVTPPMRSLLQAAFHEVKLVDILDSKDEANLKLLSRPELGITFTKLHCWKLTNYEKCVFLDADTLVLENSDDLFNREELSAAPDVGWPDCFNSGVFVFKPSEETFNSLINFALENGSFDGGDQGLLNSYFSDWATGDIKKHLPFVYNLSSAAVYSYLPAFKQFGKNAKIVHFISDSKPWLQSFNPETRQVDVPSTSQHLKNFLQLWWNIFCDNVHPALSNEMTEAGTSNFYPRGVIPYYDPTSNYDNLSFNDFTDDPQAQYFKFTDPWEEYESSNIHNNNPSPTQIPNMLQNYDNIVSNDTTSKQSHEKEILENSSNQNSSYHHQNSSCDHQSSTSCHQNSSDQIFPQISSNLDFHKDSNQTFCDSSNTSYLNSSTSLENFTNEPQNCNVFSNPDNENSSSCDQSNFPIMAQQCTDSKNCDIKTECVTTKNKDNNVLSFNTASSFLNNNNKYYPSSMFVLSATTNNYEEHDPADDTFEPNNNNNHGYGGLARSFAEIKLGEPLSPEQKEMQDHLRRQNWEQGNIDYMNRDSFNNIWGKILSTLSLKEKSPEAPQESSDEKKESSEEVSSGEISKSVEGSGISAASQDTKVEIKTVPSAEPVALAPKEVKESEVVTSTDSPTPTTELIQTVSEVTPVLPTAPLTFSSTPAQLTESLSENSTPPVSTSSVFVEPAVISPSSPVSKLPSDESASCQLKKPSEISVPDQQSTPSVLQKEIESPQESISPTKVEAPVTEVTVSSEPSATSESLPSSDSTDVKTPSELSQAGSAVSESQPSAEVEKTSAPVISQQKVSEPPKKVEESGQSQPSAVTTDPSPPPTKEDEITETTSQSKQSTVVPESSPTSNVEGTSTSQPQIPKRANKKSQGGKSTESASKGKK